MGYISEMEIQGYNSDNIDLFHKIMIPFLIREIAKTKQNDLILDIGSGSGHSLFPLWEVGYRNLVALDIETDNFQKFNLYKINCHSYNAEKDFIPYSDNTIAVVLAIHLIEHLPSPSLMLSECYRILKPGGFIFIVTPDWRKQMKTFYRDPTHIHPYDKISLARVLRIANFMNVFTSAWNSRYGLGRVHAYRFFPRLGMIGKDLFAQGTKQFSSNSIIDK